MRAEEIESRVKQQPPLLNPFINGTHAHNIMQSNTLPHHPPQHAYNTMMGSLTPRPIHHPHPQQQNFKYNTLPANTSMAQYYQQYGGDASGQIVSNLLNFKQYARL